MKETSNELEARLAAASIAWQDMLAAEATTTRLRRYSHLTKQMELDFSRANRRFYEARAELSRLLKTPHPETLSPASASKVTSIAPLDRTPPDAGGCFMSPRSQTGD